jgi:uncharacterized protein (TIGR03083 family)
LDEPINKALLLERIQADREALDTLLAGAPEEQMTKPGVVGQWSLKDIIAHITWHEQQMVIVLQERRLAGSDLWNLTTDERNHAIYEQNRDRPLAEVLAESRQVYELLLESLQTVADADLNDPALFQGMPPDWIPAQLIAHNTYEHYRHHLDDIRAWLRQE